jgi:hypothetical protein
MTENSKPNRSKNTSGRKQGFAGVIAAASVIAGQQPGSREPHLGRHHHRVPGWVFRLVWMQKPVTRHPGQPLAAVRRQSSGMARNMEGCLDQQHIAAV